VSEERISSLADWRRTDLFTPEERLALEYAEATTLDTVDDDLRLRLRLKARWSDGALIELTGLIAFQNLSAKFNSALDVPAQGFCRLSQ
jgi:alkylhydroperoxidase family enzyme